MKWNESLEKKKKNTNLFSMRDSSENFFFFLLKEMVKFYVVMLNYIKCVGLTKKQKDKKVTSTCGWILNERCLLKKRKDNKLDMKILG